MYNIGYERSNHNNCVYINGKQGDDQIVLLLYVDDILIAGKRRSILSY